MSALLSITIFGFHASVTWFQLNRGGLGWLGKPNWYWIGEFWTIIFQQNIGLALLAVISLVYIGSKSKFTLERKFLLMTVLCVGILAYIVSMKFTPILREIVMQYIFPFLFLGVVGSWRFSKNLVNNLGTLSLGLVLAVKMDRIQTEARQFIILFSKKLQIKEIKLMMRIVLFWMLQV